VGAQLWRAPATPVSSAWQSDGSDCNVCFDYREPGRAAVLQRTGAPLDHTVSTVKAHVIRLARDGGWGVRS